MSRSLIAWAQTRLRALRYSYLFLPALIGLGFSGAAVGLTNADGLGGARGLVAAFPAGPEGARVILSTIAASLITIAGLAFSITVVSLQLVSQQFTPRALRGFLGDRLNQTVAGVFVGVFLYCILVLRTVDSQQRSSFVPGLSVTVGIVLSVVALGALLVFINHMTHSIQVGTIAARISHQTLRSASSLYPHGYGEGSSDDAERLVQSWRNEAEPVLVRPDRPGFVQAFDDLPHTISGRGYRIEVLVGPGDFVTEAHPLAAVWTTRDHDECATALRRTISVASERDLDQDTAYGIRQLADIAVKALSPSVNDPTTATTCIGYLQAILEKLAVTEWPVRVRRFPRQDVTIVMRPDSFDEYVESLVQVGRYATGDARVVDALLKACARVKDAAAEAGHHKRAASAGSAASRIAERALRAGNLDEREQLGILDHLPH